MAIRSRKMQARIRDKRPADRALSHVPTHPHDNARQRENGRHPRHSKTRNAVGSFVPLVPPARPFAASRKSEQPAEQQQQQQQQQKRIKIIQGIEKCTPRSDAKFNRNANKLMNLPSDGECTSKYPIFFRETNHMSFFLLLFLLLL